MERLRQADFLNICGKETGGFLYTRSFQDVLATDVLLTLSCLRKLYIPRYSPDEMATFLPALEWVRDNSEFFSNVGFVGGPRTDELPSFVRAHNNCISYSLIFLNDMEEMPRAQLARPVAFLPGTERWSHDVKSLTVSVFERLKNHPLENREFSGDYDSTTKTLRLIREFFDSGGFSHREEASDSIVSILFLEYWKVLKRRARSSQK